METAFQQEDRKWKRDTGPAEILVPAISKHSGAIKAKDGCGSPLLSSIG
jgi:hypothetical protein